MMRQANMLLVILATFLLAHWLRFGYAPLKPGYLVALLVSLVLASVVLPATGAFRREFEWEVLRRLRRLVAGWAVVLVALISTAAMLKTTDYYSRIWFGLWTILSTLGLILAVLISHLAAIHKRNQNRQTHPVVLVGSGAAAARVEEHMKTDPASDMTVVARFGKTWNSEPVQPVSELAAYLQANKVHAVWIAVPWEDKHTLDESLRALRETVVDVHVVPDLEQYRLLNQSISEWSGLPVISLAGTPMTDAERRLKTWLDWLVAVLLAVFLSPLFLIIALLIKVGSRGPVFFRQLRHGVGGEAIEILKFRTMKLHREAPGQVTQASPDDQRVTPVGRFLRRTSLDELPQLYNVLKGDLSLVGPRPHAVEHTELYKSRVPKYMLRHKVKPGITGWAQVNGLRGQTDTPEKMVLRIQHDLWYIQNWSLWLDVKILMITPFAMMDRNAY